MEVHRSRWYAAILVLPSEGFDAEEGMSACQGAVVVALDSADEAALFSTQVVLSVV